MLLEVVAVAAMPAHVGRPQWRGAPVVMCVGHPSLQPGVHLQAPVGIGAIAPNCVARVVVLQLRLLDLPTLTCT